MIRALSVFSAALLASVCLANFQVASGGKSNCVIAVDPSAAPAEKQAAKELSDYLGQISGATIPMTETTKRPDGQVIVVGQGELARKLFHVSWNRLHDEQTLLQGNEKTLLVAGGRPRGTLYSAYRLLNRLGVQWWTPWATDVPRDPDLSIPTETVSEEPSLEYRDPSFHSEYNTQWAAHNFCNEGPATPELGGGVNYEGFVHTYYPLIPPEKYFKAHPEWFSLINGKRTADDAQLCTTNPELRKAVLEQVKELLRKNPNANIVSVSQNDCFNQCQCDVCQALAKKEGSQAAPVIALANYVAAGIKKEFPHVAVDTLAYQWSRHAPKTLKPLPNVIVRLCSIECDFSTPLDSDKNKDFAKDVLDWSRLTHRLYVWDYVTNFANYLQPMPDEAVIGPNLKFLAAHGVKGVFEEGDYTSNGGSMSNMKAWVLSRLLWDPNADGQALERQFATGYYGAAADPIMETVRLFAESAAKTQGTIYLDPKAPFLSPDLVLQAEGLWQDAEKRVSGEPEKLWRVKESHLGLQFVLLARWDELKKYAADHSRPWTSESKSDLASRWLAFATSPGPANWEPVTAVNEGSESPKAFVDAVLKRS